MIQGQTKELFQLQTELVDMKVDMAVGKAIDRVIDQITDLRKDMHSQIYELRNEMHTEIRELKNEMHAFRNDVNDRFFTLGQRVTAIETKLGMTHETKAQIKSKIIEYVFKAISAISAVGFAYVVLQFQMLIK